MYWKIPLIDKYVSIPTVETPMTLTLIGMAAIALATWGWMHPHDRSDGPFQFVGVAGETDDGIWHEGGTGGGGYGMTFGRHVVTYDDGSFRPENVMLQIRPYWAHRIFPRTFYQVSFRYVWLGDELPAVDGSVLAKDVTGTVKFVFPHKTYGPYALAQVYATDTRIARKKDAREIIVAISNERGPFKILLEFFKGGKLAATREIVGPEIGEYDFYNFREHYVKRYAGRI